MTGVVAAMSGEGGGDIINIDADTVSSVGSGNSTSGWRLSSDGQVYFSRTEVSGGAYIAQYNWCTPTSNAGNYKCQWTIAANTVDSTPGAQDTDLALSSTRTWSETDTSGVESCSFTVRIYRSSDSVLMDSAVITLDVDASP